MARLGLTAKGIVYCLLGTLAFLAAFHINGTGSEKVDKKGVLGFVSQQPGGRLLLGILAAGLLCYSIWRFITAFQKKEEGKPMTTWAKKGRYIFSGLIYLSLAVYAVRQMLHQAKNSQKNQAFLSDLFHQPFGQVAGYLMAGILVATGLYQGYYGLWGKYKKHVGDMGVSRQAANILLLSGKIGYLARAVVWMLLAYMLTQATLHANASEAGDTSNAFGYLQQAAYGPYLFGLVGLGLICYGIFNFIRARFETFR